jgi:hypothetical protein
MNSADYSVYILLWVGKGVRKALQNRSFRIIVNLLIGLTQLGKLLFFVFFGHGNPCFQNLADKTIYSSQFTKANPFAKAS